MVNTIKELMEDYNLTGEEIYDTINFLEEQTIYQVEGYITNIDELKERAVGLAVGSKDNIMKGVNGLETNYLFAGQCLTSAGYASEIVVSELCDILRLKEDEISQGSIHGVYDNVKTALDALSYSCETFKLVGSVQQLRIQVKKLERMDKDSNPVFQINEALITTKIILGIAKLNDDNLKRALAKLEVSNSQDKIEALQEELKALKAPKKKKVKVKKKVK